jgi:hypothetical protein
MRFLVFCLICLPAVASAEIVTFNEFTTSTPLPQTFNSFTLQGTGSIEPIPLKNIAFQTPYAFMQLDNTHSASILFTEDVTAWGADLDTGLRTACVISKRLFLASSASWLYDNLHAYATLSIDDPTTPNPIDQTVQLSILDGPPTAYAYNAGTNFIRSIHFTSADQDICQPLGMDNVFVQVVPEPSAFIIFGIGLVAILLWRKL